MLSTIELCLSFEVETFFPLLRWVHTCCFRASSFSASLALVLSSATNLWSESSRTPESHVCCQHNIFQLTATFWYNCPSQLVGSITANWHKAHAPFCTSVPYLPALLWAILPRIWLLAGHCDFWTRPPISADTAVGVLPSATILCSIGQPITNVFKGTEAFIIRKQRRLCFGLVFFQVICHVNTFSGRIYLILQFSRSGSLDSETIQLFFLRK